MVIRFGTDFPESRASKYSLITVGVKIKWVSASHSLPLKPAMPNPTALTLKPSSNPNAYS